jgi:hypothetical protein
LFESEQNSTYVFAYVAFPTPFDCYETRVSFNRYLQTATNPAMFTIKSPMKLSSIMKPPYRTMELNEAWKAAAAARRVGGFTARPISQ